MSNPLAPHHGGTTRIAFNGGTSQKGELQFLARSVNVDNWSSYWYKLNPIEEYIPPFSHSRNIRLPLIKTYQFVPEAPPGIQQPTIVISNQPAGNFQPVIVVFSSQDTNNDPGLNAIDAAANFVATTGTANGASPLTLATIDMTLFNGISMLVKPNSNMILEVYNQSQSGMTVYKRQMVNGERLLLTLPKVGQQFFIRAISDPNSITNPLAVTWSYRELLGIVTFSEKLFLDTVATDYTTAADNRFMAGASQTVSFTTVGIDEGSIIVEPTTGWANGDIFDFFVFPYGGLSGFIGPLTDFRFHVWYSTTGRQATIIPIRNINGADLLVGGDTPAGNKILSISFVHKLLDPLDATRQNNIVTLTAAGGGVWTSVAIPSFARLRRIEVACLTNHTGFYLRFALGNAATQFQHLFAIPTKDDRHVYEIDGMVTPGTAGFTHFWAFNSDGVGFPASLVITFVG